MKQYIALMLADLMLAMTACSSGEVVAEETAAETEVPLENEAETEEETVPEEEP